MVLPDALARNYGWKIGSLLMAVVIWYSIHRSVKEDTAGGDAGFRITREFDLPITVMTSATETRTFLIRPRSVRVTVRGYAKALTNLQATNIRVYVDLVALQGTSASTCKVQVHLPPSLTLVRANPDEVQVRWPASAEPSGLAVPVPP